ncbi:GNAT family N-acetyltransferase [Ginsengibacter hankyongi]|nr:GNAT family N-acetyltransferase [Ginsengibacter hankyongi]
MNIDISDNTTQQQFEITMDGELATLQYRFYKNDIALMHTHVPERLKGRGLATALANFGLEWAKSQNKKVMVYCPFVSSYLKKRPEYNYLIDKNYV